MTYILFAKWFGITSLTLSLGILFHLNDAKKMAAQMIRSDTGYIMGGVLPIIFGTFALVNFFDLTNGWKTVITFISLFIFFLGCYRVLFVNHWKRLLSRHADKIPALFSLFGLMVGLLLLYIAYIAPLTNYPLY